MDVGFRSVDFGSKNAAKGSSDGTSRRPETAAVRDSWRRAGVGLQRPLGASTRPRRAMPNVGRGARVPQAGVREGDVRCWLARDACMDAEWLRALVERRGGNRGQLCLAARPAVLPVPWLSAAGDPPVRARRQRGALVSAMLGPELYEPVVELQGNRWLACLGPVAYVTTQVRRRERREESRERYAVRRALPPNRINSSLISE